MNVLYALEAYLGCKHSPRELVFPVGRCYTHTCPSILLLPRSFIGRIGSASDYPSPTTYALRIVYLTVSSSSELFQRL